MNQYVITYTGKAERLKSLLQKKLEVIAPNASIERPMLESRSTRNGKTVKSRKEKFPGYMFLQLENLTDDIVATVNSVTGVKLLSTVPIEDLVETEVQSVESIPIKVAEGDLITIKSGSFSGFKATVMKIMEDKVEVSISIFGRSTDVVIDAATIGVLEEE